MITADLRIAELLCTRLNHDVTGPVGAISNGVELLTDKEFDMEDQAVDLIVSSAKEAVARLVFYRMAYGRVKDSGEADLTSRRKVVSDYFSHTKVQLDWPDHHTDAAMASVSVNMSRLLFNMLILSASTLIRGGVLSVRVKEENGVRNMTTIASSDTIRWDEELSPALDGKVSVEELSAKNVQAYLTYRLAEELGVGLEFREKEGTFEIIAKQS
jgi:histidine phosphotransferase ChpT